METLASNTSPEEKLREENAELRARLADAEDALRAIRSGKVDSLLVETEDRPQTFSLDATEAGSNRLRGEILDQVSDAVGMIDNDDRITYLNPACERLYRVQPGEMLGRKLSELYQRRWLKPGDEAAAVATLREQGEASWELIHVCRDGRELHVHSSVCLMHDASGKVTGIIAAIRDITEQKATEEKLRERENFLQRLTDVSPSVIQVFDLEQKRSVFISRTVASVIGYSEEEIAAMGDNAAMLLMHPDDLARFPEHLERVRLLDDHETIDFEHRMRNRTGEWHWFHSRDSVFSRDAAGAVRQLIGTAIEITARKQVEERFRQTLMNVSVPTLLHADDGTILLVNQAWTDITGYRIEDIPTLEDWTRKAYGEQHLTAHSYIEDLFKHDTRQDDGEWIVTTARGDKRVWHFSSTPLGREPSGRRLIVSNAIDITDRKRAEVAMVESKSKLDVAMQVGGIGAWSLDVNTQTLRGDPILKNLFGFDAEDSPPLDQYFNRIHPDDRNRISQAVADAMENNTIYDQEYRIDLPDGSVRWARSYAQNFPSTEGSVKEFTGITYDVTDRKLRELELVDRESHLRRVIDNMLGFVGVLHTDGTLLEANQTALAAGGVSRDDVIGRKFWDCIWWNYDPDVIKHLQDSVERALSGETVRYDVDIRITGDARLTIDFMLVPVRDQDGSITHLIPSGVDITDRKAAEFAVAESQRKLQLGIEVAAFSLAEVDYVTQTIELSSDAAQLFGLENTPTVVPRQQIHDLFHPEDQSRIHAAIDDCLEPGGAGQIAMEHRIVLPDGTTRWLDVRQRVHFDSSASSRKPLRGTVVARDVTQEKLLQSELIENRERLTLAMQSARMGAFQWEPDTDITQWDDVWSAVIGVDKDAPKTGKTFFNLVHPDDIAALMAATPTDTKTQSEYRAEYRIVRPDGQLRWLAASGILLPSQNGHPSRLVGLNWDITEQKESAERIRQGEERLRLAMTAAQLSLWEWDIVNDQVSWAKELYDRQSIDRMTPIGGFDGFINMVHVDDRKRVRGAIKECLSEGKSYHCEFRMRRGDGSYRWVLSMAHLSTDGYNTPVRMVGVEMDITDRKENEVRLSLSAERLTVAADAAGFGMLHVDLKLQTVTFSPEMKRIIGWRDDQTVSLEPGRMLEFVHPDDRELCARHYEMAIMTNSPTSRGIDHRIVRTDGTIRWVRLQTKTLFSEQTNEATQIIATVLDISQQRVFEEQLKAARDAAEAANQSKSAFVANMSHEIRTPMTAILGYADLIRDMIENPEAVRHLQTIRRNGDYLLEIINDILDLSKIEAGKLDIEMERFQPVRLIEDVRSVMEVRATEGGLTLEVEYDGKLPQVIESDAKRLKQILINLVGNAIKFTYEGQVKIRVRYHGDASVSVCGLENQDTGMLQFDIIDTGIGMTQVQQERLFKPFSQGDASVNRNFGGTGLGLAISQRLAEMLGGAITVSSTEGVGSTFSVAISTGRLMNIELVDYAIDLADKQNPIQPTATEVISLDCNVLIVDDRRDIRFLSKHFLSKAGASVDEAEDGQLALDFVRNRLAGGSPPALILLDMQMPNLDGYETARLLRASGFLGPIVALTADAMQGDMNRCLEAGCNDYLSKPIDAVRLVQLVRELTRPQQDFSNSP